MRKISVLLLVVLLTVAPLSVEASTLQQRVAARRATRMRQPSTRSMQAISPRRRVFTTDGVVTRVIDGSVFQIRIGSRLQTVRTLGSEAPIVQTGTRKQQCFAEKSKEVLSNLILGKEVRLQKDDLYRNDQQGRWLRYVSLGTRDIGSYMIDNGYSFADKDNSYSRSLEYALREEEANTYNIGLWGPYCDYNQTPDIEIEILE